MSEYESYVQNGVIRFRPRASAYDPPYIHANLEHKTSSGHARIEPPERPQPSRWKHLLPVLRYLLLFAVLIAVSMLIILIPSGDTACQEWDGWRFEQIWPRPEGCAAPDMGE